MSLFGLGLLLMIIGAIANIHGNTSKFSAPTGGASRISPENQVRLNDSVQRITGTKETYDSFYNDSNKFKLNKIGLIIFIIGAVLVVVEYL